MTAAQIIKFFNMKPLPQEGGFYIETYRAAERLKKEVLLPEFSGARNLSSAILYLLTADTISSLHRLKSDEMFHFYLGDPVTMLQLHPDERSEIITLGHDIFNEQKVQVLVPKGAWQGAFIKDDGRFALMSCTVTPGFDFADYEQADRKQLLKQYPAHKDLITRLTRQ